MILESSNFIKAGLIGHPVGHSLSPVIHNHWIAQYGLRGQYYNAHDIPPDKLRERVKKLVDDGYTGLNVTIPHKQEVMKLCHSVSDTAARIGAVNTLLIDPSGHLHGDNTDAFGFIENIRACAPDFDFTAAPALVLGAGGASRAIIYSLHEAGVPVIHLTNRTRERADKTAQDFKVKTIDWKAKEATAAHVGLVVNATALGMKGQKELEFDVDVLKPSTLVVDIVYNPLMTNLLKDAAARGLRTVDGLGMLLHQARPAFHQWFGVLPDITDELRAKLEGELA